ncbi:MAG: 2-isopropylmalate synthase [Candidatus Sumerlaeaceae bacterium]|nr:2-isopropylmalate synthase [Candidatus Sumerlaeaceae bacterium]
MSKDNRIIVFDTTLRDGEQSPGCTMNIKEKLEIAHQLARLGVDVIEAGFPISSQGDFEAVKLIATEVQGPTICGLARATEKDIVRCGEAVAPAKKGRIHTFIATSQIHLEKKLRMSKEQVIENASKAVALAKTFTQDVEFSCEDAGRTDWDYMVEVITAAIDAGATTINVPDTVGYCTPWQFGDCIAYLRSKVRNADKAIFSVHCHNDLGMAVANSLSAIRSGARQVECTINGIGERAGNASLEEIVMNLQVRKDFYEFTTNIKASEIYRTSRLVSKTTGMKVQRNKAIVGANAFAHEAGIHQDGVLKERTTYEIMCAEDVGWSGEQMVLGKHSGRHAFKTRLVQLGYDTLTDDQVNKAFTRFKDLCDKKKDIFDEDLYAIVEEEVQKDDETYTLDYVGFSTGTETVPTATVKLRIGGDIVMDASVGDGPVDAAFKAVQRITNIEAALHEYSLEAVTGGRDALGQVTVVLEEGGRTVRARAASTDVLVASVKAYLNAVNKLIALHNAPPQEVVPKRGM